MQALQPISIPLGNCSCVALPPASAHQGWWKCRFCREQKPAMQSWAAFLISPSLDYTFHNIKVLSRENPLSLELSQIVV